MTYNMENEIIVSQKAGLKFLFVSSFSEKKKQKFWFLKLSQLLYTLF